MTTRERKEEAVQRARDAIDRAQELGRRWAEGHEEEGAQISAGLPELAFQAAVGRRLAELYLEETGFTAARASKTARIELGEPLAHLENLSAEELEARQSAVERLNALSSLVERFIGPAARLRGSTLEPLSPEERAALNVTEEDERAARALLEAKLDNHEPVTLGGVNGTYRELAPPSLNAEYDRLAAKLAATEEQRAEALREHLTDEDGARRASLVEWLRARDFETWAQTVRVHLEALARQEAEQRAEEAEQRADEAERRADEAERQRRLPLTIRWGTAGYNAMHRSRRMVEDLVEREEIKLSAQHEKLVQTWSPGSIPLVAREALLGLLGILTQSGMMPNLSPSGTPGMEYVMVPVPGGLSQIADACGFTRSAPGRYGDKHDSSTTRRIRKGLNWLTEEAQNFFHVWEEYNPRRRRKEMKYSYVKAAIAQLYSEGDVLQRAGVQADLFLSPYAQFVALHPYALLGARVNYHEMPGDVLIRYRQALAALGEEARTAPELEAIIGPNPRPIESDVELFLWCYMHGRRQSFSIGNDKLMERIGLQKLLDQRKVTEAEKRLQRALLVAQRMGALAGVDRSKNGAPVYLFPGDWRDEPAGLIGGTLDLPLEVEEVEP